MKKITTLTIVSILFFSGLSYAQYLATWNYHYQHTTSPGFSNEGRKIAEDASGNIYMLADVTSDLDPQGMHSANTYYYVTLSKFSTNGTLLNTINLDVAKMPINGYNMTSAFGLELDASANIYIGYTVWSSASSYDVVLAKYDNTLTNLWKNAYTLTGADAGVDFKLNQTTQTIYALMKNTAIQTNYSLIKSVPSNSSAVLVRSWMGSGIILKSLALDGAQKAYVVGSSPKGTHTNAYVAEVSVLTNNLVWSSTFSQSTVLGDDVANQVTVGVDGKIYTVGTSYQGGWGDQVVVLRNSPGNPHFDYVKILKTSASDNRGLQINATENGWVYVGSASSTMVNLFRFPSNGVFTNASTVAYGPVPTGSYTAITGISLTSMKVSSAKNIYITGGVSATSASGSFTCSYLNKASVVFGNALVKVGGVTVEGEFNKNYEGLDLCLDYSKADVYWLRNFSDDTHNSERVELLDVNVPAPLRESQSSLTETAAQFSLSPNPANDRLKIQSDKNIVSVEIMDIAGNKVLSSPIGLTESVIDVSGLANGIYFCKVHFENQDVIKRVVIQ